MQILSPITQLAHPLFKKHNIKVFVKRDDLIHPIISGNKWRKLKYNLSYAQNNGYQGILSFGGAYSNHIHALAYAGKLSNIATIGIIRGENHYQENATLSQAKTWGMNLSFVDRKTYQQRNDDDYLSALKLTYPNYYLVPEGGSNDLAVQGVSEVIKELNQQLEFDTLLTPVGSGGTLSGLINGDKNQHQLLGISVLKQMDYLTEEVKKLLPKNACQYNNWQILNDYHCGGYGKFSANNIETLVNFNSQTNITFEPIYSGKMIIALLDLVQQGYFANNSKIVLLHTGGLQGINGLIERGKLDASQWHLPTEQQAH